MGLFVTITDGTYLRMYMLTEMNCICNIICKDKGASKAVAQHDMTSCSLMKAAQATMSRSITVLTSNN